jgi:ABC-type glycerol-3-phosphate transport system substrate-binding protein
MNTNRKSKTLAATLVAFALLFLSGCKTTSPQESASTIKVTSPMGKSVDVSLPKNLETEGFELVVNPGTGEYRLSADTLKTDASGVIDSAGEANAKATAAAAAAIEKIADRLPISTGQP